MSQSQLVAGGTGGADDTTEVAFVDGEGDAGALLAALDDSRCREIIEATDGQSLSATEVAEACEIPLSTTYRKLETLTETGLLVERTRLSPAGSHPSEYRSVVDEIVLSVDGDDGLRLQIFRESNDEAVGGSKSLLRR